MIIGVEDAGNKSYCDLLFYVDASVLKPLWMIRTDLISRIMISR